MDLDTIKARYERSQTFPYPPDEIEESLADIPTLITEVESLKVLLHRVAKKRVDGPPGQDHEGVSQISIRNLGEETDVEVLRAEIRKLDNRLCWLYRNYDEEGFRGIQLVFQLMDQRDEAHRQMTRFHGLLHAAREWHWKWDRDRTQHPGLYLQVDLDLVQAIESINIELPSTLERLVPVLEALAEWRANIETYVAPEDIQLPERDLLDAFAAYCSENKERADGEMARGDR